MSALPQAIQQRQPGTRQRILKAAAELFASEGIRAVGVDRLISRASVTKATFYKHFGSKDRVVCEYLSAVAQEHYTALERTIAEAATPRAALAALADSLLHTTTSHGMSRGNAATWASEPSLRGSLFVNAAVEFADPKHPVRIIVASHYSALTLQLDDLVQKLGHARPADAINDLMIAYIGALTWGSAARTGAAFPSTPAPSTAHLLAATQACQRSFDRVCDEASLPGARPVEFSE